MANAAELLKQGRHHEFWQRYCGFLDLALNDFMAIQARLLEDQLRLLAPSALGRKIIGGDVPLTLAEFRRVAPITSYQDYADVLSEQREDLLPVKPVCWARTSDTTGEHTSKWAPITPAYYDKLAEWVVALATLSSAKSRGDITIEEGATLLYAAAPPPYLSGIAMHAYPQEFPFQAVPPTEEAEKMTFQERVQQGFERSMGAGIDYFIGNGSVLLRMGETFTHGARHMSLSPKLLRPATVSQLGKAYLTSKLSGRGMLPKDIWHPKGIVAFGMDVQVYRQRIKEYWGRTPSEAYACSEFGGIALQAWGETRPGLVMAPDSAFWEFMPEPEYRMWRQDPTYRPKTLLLDEVQPGKYVLVGSSLVGGPFIRYVLGDLIKVVALQDEELGIGLPQIVVESRVDGVISLGTMVVFTERSLWRALGQLNLGAVNWTAHKEFSPNRGDPLLRVLIEGAGLSSERLSSELHEALIETDEEYAGFYDVMETNPIRTTVLTPGTFQGYSDEKQAQGVDLGQLKPPKMQPTDQAIESLLAISAKLDGKTH